MKKLQIICWTVALTALPALAMAQQKARPDPADSKVSVPPVIYVSPLKQYQPLGDEQVTSWKAANEVVEKAGGWKAYAKEAQQPDVGTKAPASPAQQPLSSATPSIPQPKPAAHDGHAGHKKN